MERKIEEMYYHACRKHYFSVFMQNEERESYYKGQLWMLEDNFMNDENKKQWSNLKESARNDAKRDYDYYFKDNH